MRERRYKALDTRCLHNLEEKWNSRDPAMRYLPTGLNKSCSWCRAKVLVQTTYLVRWRGELPWELNPLATLLHGKRMTIHMLELKDCYILIAYERINIVTVAVCLKLWIIEHSSGDNLSNFKRRDQHQLMNFSWF